MKAFEYTEYGSPDVLHLVEAAKPTPKDDEVLIKIRAASVNPLDWRIMTGKPFFLRLMIGGLRRPKPTRPGIDGAGVVESVGRNVTRFKPGDAVFGSCRGALAEYACTPESKVVSKPERVTFEQAASVTVAAITALQGLRDRGHIQPGQKVLLVGASGGVGTFAVQIAKAFGAEVTALCSTGNVDIARSIGADHVIDYTREDFTKSGKQYDLIFAANAHRSIFDYRRALRRNGIYVMAGGGWPQILQGLILGPLLSGVGGKKLCFFGAKVEKTDLEILKEYLETGTIVPIIDRQYTFAEAAEALRYLEEGHARGKVVVTAE
jgi:NADPH:quinone reductase-like Zn-dependent oxidoreductase